MPRISLATELPLQLLHVLLPGKCLHFPIPIAVPLDTLELPPVLLLLLLPTLSWPGDQLLLLSLNPMSGCSGDTTKTLKAGLVTMGVRRVKPL